MTTTHTTKRTGELVTGDLIQHPDGSWATVQVVKILRTGLRVWFTDNRSRWYQGTERRVVAL